MAYAKGSSCAKDKHNLNSLLGSRVSLSSGSDCGPGSFYCYSFFFFLSFFFSGCSFLVRQNFFPHLTTQFLFYIVSQLYSISIFVIIFHMEIQLNTHENGA